jgi:hypothetical protein
MRVSSEKGRSFHKKNIRQHTAARAPLPCVSVMEKMDKNVWKCIMETYIEARIVILRSPTKGASVQRQHELCSASLMKKWIKISVQHKPFENRNGS